MRSTDSFPAEAPADHADRLASSQRLGALNASGLLDSLPEESFDRIVRLATHLTGVPVGLFSLVTDQRQFFKAQQGLPEPLAACRQTPLDQSVCQYVVSLDRPLVVGDAQQDPLLRAGGAVRDLGVVAYLGVPVHGPGGEALGSLCAIDGVPRDWSEADLAAMADMAAILETEIALRHAARERQMILTELAHRTKNLFAIVGSIVRMSRRDHDDPAEMAAEIERRMEALSAAHGLIMPGLATMRLASVAVSLEALLNALLAPYEGLGARIRAEGPAVMLGSNGVTSLALALHEMATNSVKYGALGAQGALSVTWRQVQETVEIDWIDEATATGGDGDLATGFGSQLISMTIEGQLEGEVLPLPEVPGWALRLRIPLSSMSA